MRRRSPRSSSFRLYGFGHRVYKNFDPRSRIIRDACDRVFATLKHGDPLLDIARKLEELALKDQYFIDRNLYPNVDFYSGLLLRVDGDSDQHVHGHLLDRPAAGLDRPLARTAQRSHQPDSAAAAGLHRTNETNIETALAQAEELKNAGK